MGAQSCEGHTPRACSHPCSPTSLLLAKQAKGGNTHEPHKRRQHRPRLDGEESHVRGQKFALVNLNLLKRAFAAPLQTHVCLRVALMRPMGTRAGRKEPGKGTWAVRRGRGGGVSLGAQSDIWSGICQAHVDSVPWNFTPPLQRLIQAASFK